MRLLPPRDTPLTALTRRQILLRLFVEYFKIALFVIGGGHPILVAADDMFGRRMRWLREGELVEQLPIIQMVPGLIAGNSAVYVGLKVAGVAGALVATIAVALPSFIIITLVAIGYNKLPLDNEYLQGAFIGLRAALTGILFAVIMRTWKKAMRGLYAYIVMPVALVFLAVFKVNPAWVLYGAMIVGVAIAIVFEPLFGAIVKRRGKGGEQ